LAARQPDLSALAPVGGAAVVVVVLVDVVAVVGLVTGGVVVVAGLAPAVLDALVEPPPELPHAASSKTRGSRARRFMGTAV